MWREFVAEVSSLGWRAFVFGPEIHLVLPALYAVIAIVLIFRRKK